MTKVRYKFLCAVVNILSAVVLNEGIKLSATDDTNVNFNDSSKSAGIKIDENVPHAKLFYIEEAKGIPKLTGDVNKCSGFIYEIVAVDEKYVFNLTHSLDYEEENCRTISGNVEDTSTLTYFDLFVNNLDDNPPQLILPNYNCELKENTLYTKEDTPCLITMTDRDGMMENAKFSITPATYEDIFEISFLKIPEDNDTTVDVPLYLKDRTLDYETINKYIFTVEVKEEVTSGSIQVPLDVKDMPDQPPKWTSMFTTQQFEENVDQTFTVTAIDGDIGIASPIYYEIENNGCETYTCEITIGNETGTIDVKNVDREEVGNTITFNVNAIETDDSSTTSLTIYFFIEDQDDNSPIFSNNTDPMEVSKDENYIGLIGSFTAEDMDLASNGTYDIKMEYEGSIDYTQPFQVIPTQGYQQGHFTLSVMDATNLDYEDKNWRNIKFDLVAIEEFDPTHTGRKSVIIHLNDINDEPPIFVNTDDSVSILESISKGETIFDAEATDKDAGDVVTYLIVGIWGEKLNIGTTGIISPASDNVFDYEQLQEVVLQIKATDNDEVHNTYKTLTINVLDVDDEPPTIKVGNKRVSIKENGEANEKLDVDITASDPDTKPKLTLEIDWTNSYITKNSMEVTDFDDWMCFDLTTESHEENAQKITGILKTSETCRPDFEKFDTISIGLKVIDENTEIGTNFSTGSVQVFILDVNDNPPEFDVSSFEGLKVTDGTNEVESIGTIIAHDPDISDTITYSIEPVDSSYDWVDIDSKTGQLTIKEGVVINDDIPPQQNIKFSVIASDGIHKPAKTLVISMTDINNRVPNILNKVTQTDIPEKTTSGKVLDLEGEDFDRDDAFHKIVFRFDTNITIEASNCFDITDDGHITVNLKHGATLNRDFGQAKYELPVLLYDNPTGTLQLKDHLDITIILSDINDNAPTILNETLECSENMLKTATLGPIIANDPDEEGDNSNAKFEIKDIQATANLDRNVLTTSDLQISSTDNKTATIEFLRDLEGYFGTYKLTIHTSDYGTPIMEKDNFITLTVSKFNFYAPVFVFPENSDTIVLSEDQITTSNEPLKLYDQTDLQDLEVDDSQNHKWEVKFEITEQKGEQSDLFSIKNFGTWKARLGLLRLPNQEKDTNTIYTISITASVKDSRLADEKPISVQTVLDIRFFSSNEEPEFETNKCEVDFDEDAPEEHTSDPSQPTKIATFPSGVDLPVYYILLDHKDVFQVDQHTGDLSLRGEIHYAETPSFDLKIVASKSQTIYNDPQEKSTLNVNVNVIPLNTHIPAFHPSKFNGAFLKSFNKQSTIVTVSATDEDYIDKEKLRYSLDDMSCISSVQAPTTPFQIGEVDGKITPNFILTSSMSGYCTMKVYVQDGKDKWGSQHTVDTTVQINIISTDELVQFTFLNDDSYVTENQENITAAIDEIFEEYNYRSNLADLNYDPEWRNTTANFYFLGAKTEMPIEAKEIIGNFTDFDKFTTLKKLLGKIDVNLGNFPSAVPTDVEDYLKIWLFASTIVLASLLVLISVAFFFRNRALTHRINNLSTTKFGSQESNLNRAGLAAPTTNKNAVEGSNPVFNSEKFENEIETDTRSVISTDSELFGVENNPEFDI